jgi:4-methyl-5(b-hydroxyethyl)-thiazole monophosphate biosynthesis
MSKVVIALANGCEEIEALTVADILFRAGVSVTTASINPTTTVVSSHNVTITADTTFEAADFSDTEMIVLPGGMPGTNNLQAYKPLTDKVLEFASAGKFVAAICAAPKILGALGLLEGKRACAHPGFEGELTGAEVVMDEPAVRDGKIITGRSMGCAIPFALMILGALEGEEKEAELSRKIVWMPIKEY